MKTGKASLFAIVTLIAAALLAEPANRVMAAAGGGAAENHASVEGVWRAQIDGLPAITLNVTYESGSLNGAILFYLLRKDPGKAETSSAGIPEPLMHPSLDGTTLSFAVSHKRAHGAATKADPPVHFTLAIESPGKAELMRDGDASSKFELVRDSD